jgi:hypothetical protein
MATHVEIVPIHEGKRAHAQEIVRKLEAHLGMRAKPTDDGHRFEFEDDDLARSASDLSGALDLVAPDWRDHIAMGL